VGHACALSRIEHSLRDGDLILDQRRHEKERIDVIEYGRGSRLGKVERNDVDHLGNHCVNIARWACSNTNLDAARKKRATDLTTDGTGRPGDEDPH
jgi:hypothetical protein